MVSRGKLFTIFFVLLALLVIPALIVIAEVPVSSQFQTDNHEKDSAIESIISKAREYRKAGKFEEAVQQLNKALDKFPQKEYLEKLKIELADVHFWWAKDLTKRYDHTNAIKHYEMAYDIDKIYRPKDAAIDLNHIGFVYSSHGQKSKALEYYEKSLTVSKAVGQRDVEAATINNIGLVYSVLGQNFKALEYYEKALSLRQAVGDRAGEATTLNNIGGLYSTLGQKSKALEYFKKALSLMQALGDRTGEARAFNNIGWVYNDLGQKSKALEYYEKALTLRQAVGDRAGEAQTLNSIGAVYFKLGQKTKAMEYFEKALHIQKAVGDRAGEATTLNNTGVIYNALDQQKKALEFFEKALSIRQEVGHRAGEAVTLSNLMIYWNNMNNPQLSIYYGKQLVNTYQEIRTEISELDKEIKKSFISSKEDTYRQLADLLIDEGRISEAQCVLTMLKEEEYFQFIRRDRSHTSTTYAKLDFNRFEKQWLEKYKPVMENFSNVTSEYHLLKNKEAKSDNEKKRMEELEFALENTREAYQEYLTRLKKAFAEYDENIKKGKYQAFTLADHAKALQSTLRHLDEAEGGKNAALHYMVYGGRITVIITTPDSQLVKSSEIEEKKINRMIMKYRMSVQELDKELKGNAIKKNSTDTEIFQNLYDVIFKPIDGELKKYGATNLMVFLDGVLRYIPLAALWDGESYLVQRYRMTLFTTSSLARIEKEPGEKRKILGLGASLGGSGFTPLPDVKEEISAIVNDKDKGFNGFIEGKALIDSDFTKDTLVKQLKTEDYPLVHISSHFKFSPGDETKNYLLMGDGSIMNLAEIRYKGNIFNNVELLVLAACETGIGGGNGQEIDGFGELAQQSGAKGVVATLWKVRDKSTKDLMVKFYRILKTGKVTSKIEALRQAQLELAGLNDLLDKNSNKITGKKSKYSHPYYWGPFIMIGNWR